MEKRADRKKEVRNINTIEFHTEETDMANRGQSSMRNDISNKGVNKFQVLSLVTFTTARVLIRIFAHKK